MSKLPDERWANAATVLYRYLAEQMTDEVQRRGLLDLANLIDISRPSRIAERKYESRLFWERAKAEEKHKRESASFLVKEIARMSSLPEPIFILELPEQMMIQLLNFKFPFDTIGKVLFSVHVSDARSLSGNSEYLDYEQWEIALKYRREHLIAAVGQTGYNLIGSRLISLGYLQLNRFLTELNEENTYSPAAGNTRATPQDGATP